MELIQEIVHNRRNRKIRTDRVDRYAEQMRDGEWMVSPDCIAFSYTGKLINSVNTASKLSLGPRTARRSSVR